MDRENSRKETLDMDRENSERKRWTWIEKTVKGNIGHG